MRSAPTVHADGHSRSTDQWIAAAQAIYAPGCEAASFIRHAFVGD
jgi:hypothetical protein